MLLPSDVARLVLGYLQEEGLSATSQTFIQESPNLKEYADHTTGDGTIPACVFSLFGKGLTTILNEYVAAKTRESQYEIPVMMNSLWKKLDFTLNQIKSMQNSPAISAFQRTRTRVGLANIARQRALTVASTGGGVCSTVSETSSIISPAHVSSSLISHSTPVSYTAPLTRLNSGSETQLQIQDGGRLLNTPKDSSVHIVVSEQRLNPGPMSPGRRKWDTPRKRSAAVGGSVCPGRTGPTANSTNTEQPQPEEVIDGNFPQLVIQNARDKILGDRTLQEKLAENINKILANEPVPIPSKTPSATVEPDQSIDEILGLQGEIHMSDDAIHDILEQTESDPAFQALFDLFDCNKSRVTDGGPEDGDISSSPEESDAAGPSSTVELLKSNDQAMTPTDSSVRDATATAAKTKVGHDCRVVRKNAATTLLKKTFLSSSSRGSRVESCSPRLLVTPGVSSATGNSSKKRRPTSLNSSAILTPMDIDQPLNTPPPPTDEMDTSAPATEDCSSSTAVTGSTVEGRPEVQQAQDSTEEPSTTASPSAPPVDNTTLTPNLADAAVTCGQGDSGQTGTESLSAQSCSPAAHNSPAPSSAPVDMTPHIPSIPCKATTDSGNIVSLKIIISDNQENNSTDTVLNQAISSISGDKIPTIYLSSPAKSPGPVSCPNTPKSNMDEVAQAVSCLQNSEIFASPLTGKTGALIASPLTGTSQTQQSFILQLPMNSTPTPTLQGVGAAPSYILVTDSDVQTRQVLLPAGVPQGQSLPINQFGGTTQSGCPSFSNASTLILPSPVKPVMLPVSVMGQSTVGNVQMMPNQLVAIPNPVSLQQTETITPSTVAPKQSTASAGTEEALAGKVTPPTSAERTCEQDTSKSLNHRRILCFDPSAEGQPQTANTAPPQNKIAPAPATTASPSPSDQQPQKGKSVPGSRTKPAILAGNKPKRRIEITRCPENPQPTGVFVKEVEKPTPSQPQQKDTIKKKPRKQHHSIYNQEPQSTTNSDADYPKSDDAKKSEKEKGSKTVDRKHSLGNNEGRPKTSDLHTSAKTTSDSAKKGTRNDKGESSRRDAVEKTPTKPREGRTEKKSQEMPNVTANKENEMKVGAQEQQQQSTPTSPSPRDFSPSATSQLTSPQSKGSKAQSKTSSLAKQAAEMLQDIQGLNSPSTPGKRPGEPSLPRTPCTGHNQGQITDSPRTPSLQNSAKDKEGTPKRLMPPNTPDVPTCSPASEAGSESSINMAAHTLMILSRAAIARTGTPLKDSLRQEEAAEKSPSSLKNSKKRKQSSASDSSPAKKESKRSPSRKKDRERKRLVDCFPHDLDVDKFLSSLHYDE